MQKKIAVIGAGMAGLSAAYHLQRAGFETTVFEREAFVGGRTRSIQKNGYTLDLGAITLSPAYRETIDIINDIGCQQLLTTIDPVLAIPRQGTLHELDLSRALTTGLTTKLLSTSGKLSLLKMLPVMVKYWSKCSFESMAELYKLDVESCRAFALRKLGQEVHDYLVDPIIRVNMFNSTDKTSAVDFVWLMKIFSDAALIQVKGGMDSMARSIAKDLNIHLDTKITQVVMDGLSVRVTTENNEREFDGAVVAIPVKKALEIVPGLCGHQKHWFENAKSISSLAVHVGLTQPPKTNAAMIMVPTSEAANVLGIAVENNKCKDRAPEGKGLLALHMSPPWADEHEHLDDHIIAQKAVECIESFMGPISQDIDMVNIHRWEHEDHERHVGIYKELKNVIPQLRKGKITFAGEYISAGIEGAVVSGKRCAEALQRTVNIPRPSRGL